MVHPRSAVHRTIVVVDVEGFGDRHRTNPRQIVMRDGMYRAVRRAFSRAAIPWDTCHHEDRGDGVFVLVPSEVPKSSFVDSLPGELVAALCEHNTTQQADERIRMRMALHAGEVNYDDHGVTSAAINLAFRLLDARTLKTALAGSPGVLALITSSWFFDEVVRHSTVSDHTTYRPARVVVTLSMARTLLAELTRAHLIQEHAPGRFRFHDLLRAYAAERSHDEDPQDERQAALGRVLDQYLHIARNAHQRLAEYQRPITVESRR